MGETYAVDKLYRDAGMDDFRTRIVIASACDQAGNLLFGPGDFAAAQALPFTVSDAIFDAAMALNNLTEEAKADLGKS